MALITAHHGGHEASQPAGLSDSQSSLACCLGMFFFVCFFNRSRTKILLPFCVCKPCCFIMSSYILSYILSNFVHFIRSCIFRNSEPLASYSRKMKMTAAASRHERNRMLPLLSVADEAAESVWLRRNSNYLNGY